MTDPKLIITLVAGLLCAGWLAYDRGWLLGWKLPWWGDSKVVSDQQAIEAARVLVRYMRKNSPASVQIADMEEIAAEIFRGTLK